jgi:hypothetical protein
MKGTLLESGHCTNGDATTRFSDAEIIANMLDANRFSAATVMHFGFGQWHMAALAVQVDDPSPETRAIVVQMLQGKEAARAAAEPGLASAGAGSAKSAVNRLRPAAFESWLAHYRNRLEALKKAKLP